MAHLTAALKGHLYSQQNNIKGSLLQ